MTKMSTAMERYIELVKQYPGQEQVDLAVDIEVPGSEEVEEDGEEDQEGRHKED